MSGSLVWRGYIPDSQGATVGIRRDESNCRATYNGNQLCPASLIPTGGTLPAGARARLIYAVTSVGGVLVKRAFTVATLAQYTAILNDPSATIVAAITADPADASGGPLVNWRVTGGRPEKIRKIVLTDSGLVDGTPLD